MPDRDPPTIPDFNRLCLRHPDLARESIRQTQRLLPGLHALFGDKPTPFSLTPYLRPPDFFKRMSALCADLADILESAGRLALADERLLDFYQFPDFFLNILGADPGYPRLAPVLRLDGHFVNGVFRIVETNADGSAGMNDSNAIERAVLTTPVYRRLTRTHSLESLEMVKPLARMLVAYARSAPGRRTRIDEPVRVGILDRAGVLTASEFSAVQEQLERMGAEAVIVTPGQLSRRPGTGIWAGGKRIDLVYRRLVTADAYPLWNKLSPLTQAYRAGEIRLVGSFRSELLHSKAILALLHDRRIRGKLRSAAGRLIDRHVPKAFPLTLESAGLAAASKNRWVIKPLDAYGSRGVAVGGMMTAPAWRRELDRALRAGRYLLQEFVRAPKEPVLRWVQSRPRIFREMTSVGFFLYDGKMAGPYVRSGPAHPLSISYGAVTRPGFVSSPRRIF